MILTLEEAKVFLKIGEADTSEDATIEEYCKAADGLIKTICGWPIEETPNYEYIFDGDGAHDGRFLLPFKRVSALASLEYTASLFESGEPLGVGADVMLKTINGLPKLIGTSIFSENLTYTAVLTVGYSAATFPQEVKRVAVEMVVIMYQNTPATAQGEARLGINALGTNDPASGSSTTQYRNMWDDWMKVLDLYKLPNY